MGQAKNRGSFEERRDAAFRKTEQERAAATALGLENRPIAEIIEELGLPPHSRFCGYAIHISDSDEFLLSYNDHEDSISRQWAGRPELALRFDDVVKAHRLARKENGEIVVGVFDTGDQYVIAEVA